VVQAAAEPVQMLADRVDLELLSSRTQILFQPQRLQALPTPSQHAQAIGFIRSQPHHLARLLLTHRRKMAHHAKVENGIVTAVIVTMDSDEDTFSDRMLAETGETWIRTSYNGRIRYNFASRGMVYDSIRDAFIPPKCHDEAIIDESTCRWTCTNSDHDVELPE
jgi:hypothetical protein